MSLQDHLDAGELAEAVAAATADVKREPLRPELRVTLAELMCFAGNYDRAAAVVDAAAKLYQKPAPGLTLLKQLIAAEQSRQQWFREGKPAPESAAATPELAEALQVVIDLSSGQTEEASRKLSGVIGLRSLQASLELTPGETMSGGDFRDLNDPTAVVAEFLTLSGTYRCMLWNELTRVAFHPVKTLRDLLWRPAECTRADGSSMQAFMPCLYAGSFSGSPAASLGRETEWIEAGGGLLRGVGQRMFLAGDESVPILEIAAIQIDRTGENHAGT